MKRIIAKRIVLVAMLIPFMACEKYLDLEPSQSISEDIALDTDQNVKNVLLGAYSIFDNPELYGGNILTWSELLGADGEVMWTGTYSGPRQIFNREMNAANEDARVQWMAAYRVINIANNVLSALDVVKEADRNRVEGEALFLRALMYFDLARYYGKPYELGTNNTQPAVPIILTPTRGITDENKVPRSNVEQVYERVITDLTRAASILPNQNTVYAEKGSANALLARVYLQMGNYSGARDAANTVITSAVYSLRPTYAGAFNNDGKSTEDIFVTEITSQDRFSAMTEFWSIPIYGGRDGDIDIMQPHLDLYDPADQRLALFYLGNGAMRSGKWNNQYGVVNIIRLAEMYLIRAECNFRLTTEIGDTPTNDINRLRQRAGFGANYFSSVTLDDILLERRLELAHEGHKVHDMRRLKLTIGGLPYDHWSMIFPIPAREIEANPNLEQNDNY